MAEAPRDQNRVTALLAESNVTPGLTLPVLLDHLTQRLLVNTTVTGPVAAVQPSSSTVITIDDTTTSTTLIATNSTRKEIEITNTSSAILYLLKGAGTASATNFTARLEQYGYYSTDYTGQLTGVWASDAGGSALITESE